MKRAPIVLTGTALGLAGILGYHTEATRSSPLSLTSASTAVSVATTSAAATNSSTAAATSSAVATSTSSSSTSSAASSETRSATGEDVSYMYGDLEVKVTMAGAKITNVSLARLDVSDPRSQSIDEYAIPQLGQEVISAQSADVDGVSGASYTSQAYEQSLQSALDKLGVTSSSS